MRLGLGPVFFCEWQRLSRRRRLYALRSIFVAVLFLGLFATWRGSIGRPASTPTIRQAASVGRAFYDTVAVLELSLVLLAAPAATAGAVCLDKARGSLLQVMTTDLSDAEIVLGKLAAGMAPVFGMVIGVLPVLMLTSLLGGVDPIVVVGCLAVCLGSGVFACTLAFALSVWGRRAHEVLALTYLAILFWMLAAPVASGLADRRGATAGGWARQAALALSEGNPYTLLAPGCLEPASTPPARTARYLGGCLGLSAILAYGSILGLRRAALAYNARETKPRGVRRIRGFSILPPPSLDANPVLWREWSRTRPSGWSRLAGVTYWSTGLIVTAWAMVYIGKGSRGHGEVPALANSYLVGVGLLLLSIRSATALSEERVRGSLDVLLTTPLPTSSILSGKWWGTFRLVPPLTILPGCIGVAVCHGSGSWTSLAGLIALILAYGAAVASLGLAISVWVAGQGAALAWTVGLYVGSCVGWIAVAFMWPRIDDAWIGLYMMGSPVYGAAVGTLGLLGEDYGRRSMTPLRISDGLMLWTFASGAVAIGLFLTAWSGFDRRLGRASDARDRLLDAEAFSSLLPRFRREVEASDGSV